MSHVFDTGAPKKPTNISINADLLARAKTLKINLSATMESALANVVRAKQQELWKNQNQAAITAYNDLVEKQGAFADELRSF